MKNGKASNVREVVKVLSKHLSDGTRVYPKDGSLCPLAKVYGTDAYVSARAEHGKLPIARKAWTRFIGWFDTNFGPIAGKNKTNSVTFRRVRELAKTLK